ncbi:MAG: DUF4230 domain-containing protein [Vicinamibacterales bacterium]
MKSHSHARISLHGSERGAAVVAFVLGFSVAMVIALGAVWAMRSVWLGQPRIDTSMPTVVRQVQQLQRLETVVFGMDKIVAGGQESRYLPKLLAGDRLLLMVYGEVTAGVDLGRIGPADIVISGPSVRISVPPAEIFTTRIDNEHTRVYSRETGLFSAVDPNLESEVRRVAEQQIRQAALDQGVLQLARTNASVTLRNFLRGVGFEQVDVH